MDDNDFCMVGSFCLSGMDDRANTAQRSITSYGRKLVTA